MVATALAVETSLEYESEAVEDAVEKTPASS